MKKPEYIIKLVNNKTKEVGYLTGMFQGHPIQDCNECAKRYSFEDATSMVNHLVILLFGDYTPSKEAV